MRLPKSNPKPFFRALLFKPYLNNVALGPHIYPQSVSGTKTYGRLLVSRLTNCFGYLTKEGFTYKNITKTFPVIIGEVI